ncbi:multiple epidermal growth factor-like domains protein 6 [Crassostrea angulata]|uniref:multiple epidermal growth factor-like domains protein 6 n=1 Tax=Magallana angulata TaxID=2784310 RepID=UPI0022B1C94D|nr:multiple epidermal growth factor-like domains protein 6 [Crassostrea angulata]
MDMNVVVFIVYATMIYTFSNESMYPCPGINETSCCPGHRWDIPQHKCIHCEKGYNGTNCSMICPYPSFGQNYKSNCNCILKDCDHRYGCNRTKGESDIPPSLGFIYTSLTSEYVTSKVSIPKSWYCSEIDWNWFLTYY